MASAPTNDVLPLFYNAIQPLSSIEHASWKARRIDNAPFFAKVHAVPLTVEEFPLAGRHYPIVFSVGSDPVPLALMGLNEGVNVFVDDEGQLTSEVYVPAYVRRYPFMLAKLSPEAQELSLCFDPTAEAIGDFEEGDALFANGQPSEATQNVLAFCQQFEEAGQRTAQFVKELADAKLLMDGEVAIQPDGAAQPFVYRGFQIVSEDALRELRGDVARKMIQSGLLGMVYAHLLSLPLIRELFGRQAAQGKVPVQMPEGVA